MCIPREIFEKDALEISKHAIKSMTNPTISHAGLVAADAKSLLERVESIAKLSVKSGKAPRYEEVNRSCQVAELPSGDRVTENRLHMIKREVTDQYRGQGGQDQYDRWKEDDVRSNGYAPGKHRSASMLSAIKPISGEKVTKLKADGVFAWLKCLDNVSANNEFSKHFYDEPEETRKKIKREFEEASKQMKKVTKFQPSEFETCSLDNLKLGELLHRRVNDEKMVYAGPNEGPTTTRWVLM